VKVAMLNRIGERIGRLVGKDAVTLLLALALLIVALVMPRFQAAHDTYDYVIVFDITQSMDVEDYELGGSPVSRLSYARAAVRRALRDLPCGTRIGWGAFAEYRSLLLLAPVEVCENYNDLLASLDNIDGRMRWANASEVSKGVYWAVRMAKETASKPDVVFISDGQEAPPLDPGSPFAMPDDVQPGQIHGWVVGAGGDTPQPIPHTDDEDRRIGYWSARDVVQIISEDGTRVLSAEHLSAVREPHLKALAERVGFDYMRLTGVSLTGPDSISAALRDPRFVRRQEAPTDFSWVPVTAALLLLLSQFRPRRLIFRVASPRRPQ
jgi:mxaL protein